MVGPGILQQAASGERHSGDKPANSLYQAGNVVESTRHRNETLLWRKLPQ